MTRTEPIVVALMLAASACTMPRPAPEPPPPPSPVDPDVAIVSEPDPEASDYAGAGDPCSRARARLWALHCALPGVDGKSWVAFCRTRPILFDLACMASAPNRGAFPKCHVRCPPL